LSEEDRATRHFRDLAQEWFRIIVDGYECNPNSAKSIIVFSVAEYRGNKLIRLFL